jgi:hypothetical protein
LSARSGNLVLVSVELTADREAAALSTRHRRFTAQSAGQILAGVGRALFETLLVLAPAPVV